LFEKIRFAQFAFQRGTAGSRSRRRRAERETCVRESRDACRRVLRIVL
jgi:hypothetical protein